MLIYPRKEYRWFECVENISRGLFQKPQYAYAKQPINNMKCKRIWRESKRRSKNE